MRRLLAALIVVLATWALVVALTGGADLRRYGIPFRSTTADRPALAALGLSAFYIFAFRAAARQHLRRVETLAARVASMVEQRTAIIVIAIAGLLFILGMLYGIHVAGGSDSYGYISQARLWRAGDLITEQALAREVPWPDADWTLAPLAYRPATAPGAIVPVYPAGLSVLMALATLLVGACGPYVVVPAAAAATAWLTYRLGTHLGSKVIGLAAAVLIATSPTFLFMLMNPMSDVPVCAAFTAALAAAFSSMRRRSVATGFALSLAIFIRPNLAPIAIVPLGVVLARAAVGERWRVFAGFAAGGAPLVLTLASVHTYLYGAPWRAGYGALDQFYAWTYLGPNLVQYSTWLVQTESALIVLLCLPVVAVRRLPDQYRRTVTWLAIFIAAVWLCYLFYTAFDAWWYLRFLLPAFPPMLLLSILGLLIVASRVTTRRTAVLAAAMMVVVAVRVQNVREAGVFSLWQGGTVYASAAEYVRTELPANAVVLTVQHSGSLRYYTDRLTMRWDLLDPRWWPRALDVLVERGYRPYLLISSFEEAQFRQRFGLSTASDAPGALVAEMNVPEAIRIYDPLREAPARAIESIPRTDACPCGAFRQR